MQSIVQIYLFIYKAVMYRDAKLVVLHFCTFNIVSVIDKGSKNLLINHKGVHFSN